jgi:tetratricopeptide (TPR) repeat protein
MTTGGRAEVQARYKQAGELLRGARYAEALDEYVWLWKTIPTQDPPMRGVRGSFMASEMRRLAQSYPEARKRFEALRAKAEGSDDRDDWIVLNKVLDDEQQTLTWFDEIKGKPDSASRFEHGSFRLQSLLVEKDRWADITNFLYTDPLKELTQQYEHLQVLRQFESKQPANSVPAYDPFRKSAGVFYASFLAAGQPAKANELAAESIKLSDSLDLRIELLKYASRAGQFTPDQLKWIDNAKPDTKTDASFYQKRMAMYYVLKQRESALKDCDRLIQMNGKVADYRVVRAGILVALKRTQHALEELNRAIELNPKSSLALATRGFVHCKLDNDKAAADDVDRANQLDPNLPMCHVARSVVCYRQKKYQEAYDAAAKAVDLDPSNPAGFGRKGQAAFRLGLFEEALTDLTKWTKDVDDSGEAYFYRAFVYDKLGKSELAVSDRKEAEKLGFKPEGGE